MHALSFEVGWGEVFGYVGPNGAGKTTTIRLLLDLIRPSAGRARVPGLDRSSDGAEVRRRVGYLPGDLRLYDRLTGREQLRYASLRRTDGLCDGESRSSQSWWACSPSSDATSRRRPSVSRPTPSR